MRTRAFISVVLLAVLGAFAPVAHAATVTFTADLSNFSSSPSTAYVKLLLMNCSGVPKVSGTPIATTATLTPTSGVATGTVSTNATIVCSGVTGATKWKVEVWETGTSPAPDKRIFAASYVIGPGAFDLSTAVADTVFTQSNLTSNPKVTQFVIQPSGTTFKSLGAFDFNNPETIGAKGEKESCSWGSELLTLSTGGTTTDTTANLLPAKSFIKAVVARVTTTITTATDWKLGDATTAGRFTAANSTMTAGTTDVGLLHLAGGISTDATGPVQVSAAKVRVTTTGTPGAGAIRISVLSCAPTAPTS